MKGRTCSVWSLVLCLLLCSAAAEAVGQVELDGRSERVAVGDVIQVLVDEEGGLDLAGARAAMAAGRFDPAAAGDGGEINFGYRRAAVWLHAELRRTPDVSPLWLLEVGFPSLDRIDAYLVAADGTVRHWASGDLLPFAARPLRHRNHVFPLDLRTEAPVQVFVRVESAGTLTIPLALWTPAALTAEDHVRYTVDAIYFGSLLALLLYNLMIWLSLREGAFLRYVGLVACLAVGFAGQNGFGAQFLWPDAPAWGNVAFPVGMAAAGCFAALFTRTFLDTRRTVPRLDRLVQLALASFAVAAVAPWLFGYRAAAMLVSLSALFFAAVAVASGIACLRHGHPGARYFLIAWLLLLLGVVVMAMRNFGWLPTTGLTTHAVQIGSMVEMLLLSFALADRINVMRREREEARQTVVEALRDSGLRLEARVAERTAELESANQRLRDNEQALQHLAFHDPLTGLVNRMVLDDRLRQAIGRAARSGTGLAVLVVDLDDFKSVNDRYGHAVGDEVLVAATRRMREALRASDTLARQGGDEFVVIVEPPAGAVEAEQVARKLQEALEQPIGGGGTTHCVGASIGIAVFPADGTDVESLVRAADRAMYQAKAAGRGGWRRGQPATSC